MASEAAAMLAESATSIRTDTASRPIFPSPSRASSTARASLPVMTTRMPRSSSCFDVSSPIPRFAPVTTATRIGPFYESPRTLAPGLHYNERMPPGHECYHCKQWVETGEAHDCWTTTEAALTQNLSEDLQDAWERLRETAVSLGDQRIYASHHSIMFARKSCYFFVRPKKKFLRSEEHTSELQSQ